MDFLAQVAWNPGSNAAKTNQKDFTKVYSAFPYYSHVIFIMQISVGSGFRKSGVSTKINTKHQKCRFFGKTRPENQ